MGTANARPLGVSEVDKVHKGLQAATCHHRLICAPPASQGLTGSRQVDTPLAHVQRYGAEFEKGADSQAGWA